MPNHSELREERWVIKAWYPIIVFGPKVLGLPNKSRGGPRHLSIQRWPLYHDGQFIIYLPIYPSFRRGS